MPYPPEMARLPLVPPAPGPRVTCKAQGHLVLPSCSSAITREPVVLPALHLLTVAVVGRPFFSTAASSCIHGSAPGEA
jgi:hypothetical protein